MSRTGTRAVVGSIISLELVLGQKWTVEYL